MPLRVTGAAGGDDPRQARHPHLLAESTCGEPRVRLGPGDLRHRTFQPGLTARDVYLIIASLGYFYNSNHHTLSAFLGEPIMSAPAVAQDKRGH